MYILCGPRISCPAPGLHRARYPASIARHRSLPSEHRSPSLPPRWFAAWRHHDQSAVQLRDVLQLDDVADVRIRVTELPGSVHDLRRSDCLRPVLPSRTDGPIVVRSHERRLAHRSRKTRGRRQVRLHQRQNEDGALRELHLAQRLHIVGADHALRGERPLEPLQVYQHVAILPATPRSDEVDIRTAPPHRGSRSRARHAVAPARHPRSCNRLVRRRRSGEHARHGRRR